LKRILINLLQTTKEKWANLARMATQASKELKATKDTKEIHMHYVENTVKQELVKKGNLD
jgi:hypothetical protein